MARSILNTMVKQQDREIKKKGIQALTPHEYRDLWFDIRWRGKGPHRYYGVGRRRSGCR